MKIESYDENDIKPEMAEKVHMEILDACSEAGMSLGDVGLVLSKLEETVRITENANKFRIRLRDLEVRSFHRLFVDE